MTARRRGTWPALVAGSVCALLSACSSGDPQSDAPSTPTGSPTSASGGGVCELLSISDLEQLAGGQIGEPKPGLTGGLPQCQWQTEDGHFVQVTGVRGADWAQVLPELISGMERSGLFADPENERKLREGAALIASAKGLDDTQACELFATMLEVQGLRTGSLEVISVIPSREEPGAVAGQTCTAGRYTSVMLARNQGTLEAPLPMDQVATALRTAHRRSLG